MENDSLRRYNSVLPVWLGLQKFSQADIQTSCNEEKNRSKYFACF